MALIFMDGFGYASAASHSHGVGDDLDVNWQQYASLTVTELENGTKGRKCYITGAQQNIIPRIPGSAKPFGGGGTCTLTIGMRLWIDDINQGQGLVAFGETRYGYQGILGIRASDGKLVYSIDSSGSTTSSVVAASNNAVPEQQWFYCEVTIVFADGTGGEVHFYVDGGSDGSTTGIDTKYATVTDDMDSVWFLPNFAHATSDWDPLARITDIYIRDDATLMGISGCYYQPCDTAGDDADFTPSTGSNHQNVDDVGNDGGSTYNSSSTSTDRDSFAHSDQGLSTANPPSAIQALGIVGSATDGLPATGKIGVKSGTTVDLKSFGVLSSSYEGVRSDIYETDPDTAAAWDPTDANAALTVVEKL